MDYMIYSYCFWIGVVERIGVV